MIVKKKLFIITTVPMSFVFFKGQLLLLREEFDVTLISSPAAELFQTANFNKVKSHGVEMKREISLLNDFISLLKLVTYFIKNKPNIVHGNTPKGSFLAMIAASLCRVPTRIYYVHGLRYQGASGVKKKILMAMERISCFFATDIIAVSQGVKQVLISDGITHKKINIIWNGSVNGIDLDYFNPENSDVKNIRPEYDINEDDFVFGFVGRLTGDKGINELIQAFAKININHRKTKLLLVGVYENDLDPLRKETLALIQNNVNIIYAGRQKDVRSFLKAMDVFVFPSYREGLPIVLMEAAAMNVTAISSNIIGCDEIIEEGVNGFLIPAKDDKALFERMDYILKDRSEIKIMSSLTRELISKKYEQKQLWTRTIKYYKEISN